MSALTATSGGDKRKDLVLEIHDGAGKVAVAYQGRPDLDAPAGEVMIAMLTLDIEGLAQI